MGTNPLCANELVPEVDQCHACYGEEVQRLARDSEEGFAVTSKCEDLDRRRNTVDYAQVAEFKRPTRGHSGLILLGVAAELVEQVLVDFAAEVLHRCAG